MLGTGSITGTNGNLRSRPGTASNVIGMTNNGDGFTYRGGTTSRDGYQWFKVTMKLEVKEKTDFVASIYANIN